MRTLIAVTILGGAAVQAIAAPIPIIEYQFNNNTINTGSLGAAHNGNLNGGAYSIDTPPNGSTHSLDLGGTNNNVKIPDFDFAATTTLEAWIKPSAVDGQRVLFDDYGNPGVLMTVANGQLQWSISTTGHPGPGVGIIVGTIINDQWQHVAGTYDGAMLRAYVNGVLVGSAATSGPIVEGPNQQPTLGSDDVSLALDYDGLIDDFRVFNVALQCNELAGGYFAQGCSGARVPVPASSLLLGVGLAGLFAGRRRMQRR